MKKIVLISIILVTLLMSNVYAAKGVPFQELQEAIYSNTEMMTSFVEYDEFVNATSYLEKYIANETEERETGMDALMKEMINMSREIERENASRIIGDDELQSQVDEITNNYNILAWHIEQFDFPTLESKVDNNSFVIDSFFDIFTELENKQAVEEAERIAADNGIMEDYIALRTDIGEEIIINDQQGEEIIDLYGITDGIILDMFNLEGRIDGKIDDAYEINFNSNLELRNDFEYNKGQVATRLDSAELSVEVEESERVAADIDLQSQINALWDVILEIPDYFGVDSFFDVFVEIDTTNDDQDDRIAALESENAALISRIQILEGFHLGCIPTDEICDGLDNDCDDLIDEDFANLGDACDGSDTDECMNGFYTCTVDGSGVECVNEVPENIPEVCDSVDNDCDGEVDEEGSDVCSDHGICLSGDCFCRAGWTGFNCDIPECSPSKEICDGVDNDCDGKVDEDFDFLTDEYNCGSCNVVCPPSNECVAGSCELIECDDGNPCTDDSWDSNSGCQNIINTMNVCDDGDACTTNDMCMVDGSCDGQPISCQSDTCNSASCDPDLGCLITPLTGNACDDGNACTTNDVCNAQGFCEGILSTEICDGLDNDCDGEVDEDWPDLGDLCGTGVCMGGTMICSVDGTTTVCSTEDQSYVEICDGLDNDCNGMIDDGLSFNLCPLTTDVAISACVAGDCMATACFVGYADCDDNYDNGCELDVSSDVNNCGSCGYTCDLPNAYDICEIGQCKVYSCQDGYAHCDYNENNGCEYDLMTTGNTCETAISLGGLYGDMSDGIIKTGIGSKWYSFTLIEAEPGITGLKDLSMSMDLDSPEGVTYWMDVYMFNCDGVPITVTDWCPGWIDDITVDDSRPFYVHIYPVDGTSCDDWHLSVSGDTNNC